MKILFKRWIAYLIDCIVCYTSIMLVLQWAIFSQFREQFGLTDKWFHNSLNMEMYVLITISIPVWIYFSLLDSKMANGTIGKRCLQLVVINDQNYEKVNVDKSFLRTILKLLPWELAHLGVIFPTPMYFEPAPEIRFLTLFGIALLILYVASILLNKKGQSIYDTILQTKVVGKKAHSG